MYLTHNIGSASALPIIIHDIIFFVLVMNFVFPEAFVLGKFKKFHEALPKKLNKQTHLWSVCECQLGGFAGF